MNKYKAWIDSLTPLNFANQKSLEQVLYELIAILVELKTSQDETNTQFNTFYENLLNKIDEINETLLNKETISKKEESVKTSFQEREKSLDENIENTENNYNTGEDNVKNKISEITTLLEKTRTDNTSSIEKIIEKINNLITEYISLFLDERSASKVVINTTLEELTDKIEESFITILGKITNFDVENYINNHPDEFNNAIIETYFNHYSYEYNKKLIGFRTFNIKYNPDTKSGYWYNPTNHRLYYNKNVSNDLYMYPLQLCDNNSVIRCIPEYNFGVILFPHNENSLFIGFLDTENACYFTKEVVNDETIYSISTINLSTKNITNYQNISMPTDFKDIWNKTSYKYIIKLYNNEYFLIYEDTDGYLSICKSSDLTNWTKIYSTFFTDGEATLRVINTSLYFSTFERGFLYNTSSSTFNEALYDSTNKIYLLPAFYYNNEYVFCTSTNKKLGYFGKSANADGSNITYNKVNTRILNTLEYANRLSDECMFGGINVYLYNIFFDNNYGRSYGNFLLYYNSYLQNIVADTQKTAPFTFYNKPVGNIVINENGDLYDDYNLQKISKVNRWEELGRAK